MISSYLLTHAPQLFVNGVLMNVTVVDATCITTPTTAGLGPDQLHRDRPPSAAAGPPQGRSGEIAGDSDIPELKDDSDEESSSRTGRAELPTHAASQAASASDAAAGGRTGRTRTPRIPLNISTMGDVSARVSRITDTAEEERLDRICYLAAQELPAENDRHPGWDDCKIDEMRSLILENNVWDTEHLPDGRKAISSKWVVKWKEVPTRKRKGRFTPR